MKFLGNFQRPPCRSAVILTKPAAHTPFQPNGATRQAREGSPLNVPWRLHRRSFPACAEGCGNALMHFRAAHVGQDDSVARWASGVEYTNLFHNAVSGPL